MPGTTGVKTMPLMLRSSPIESARFAQCSAAASASISVVFGEVFRSLKIAAMKRSPSDFGSEDKDGEPMVKEIY